MAAANDFTVDDFKRFSNIYAGEFNRPEMHDRVLVLDVLNDIVEEDISTTAGDINKQKKKCLFGEYQYGVTQEVDAAMLPMAIKSTENPNPVPDLNTSGGEVKRAEKRRAGFMSLRSRKIPKMSDEYGSKIEVKSKPPPGSDQRKIFVHSSWLSVHSNYFRALFYSGLRESHLKEVHLKISKSEESAHLHLIEAMYRPDVLTDLPVSELLLILVLADKYDSKFVFLKCKYVLKTKVDSVQVCEDIFHVVNIEHQMADVQDVIEAVETFLGGKFSPLDETWESPHFENLSENLLTLLLRYDNLVATCEDVVFHALMHWIKNNPKFARHGSWDMSELSSTSLLSVVRFERLSVSYLLSVVQHHKIATLMADFNNLYIKAVNYAALPDDVVNWIDVDSPDSRPSQMLIDDIVQFRWKMPEKEVLNALTRLNSPPFWACGFRMQLSLHRKFNNDNLGNLYIVEVTLEILNLEKGGFASLDWQLKCHGEPISGQNYEYYEESFVFSANTPKQSRDGSFTWIGAGSCELHLVMRPWDISVMYS